MTRTFKISGALTLVGIALAALPIEALEVSGVLLAFFAGVVFVFSLTRWLLHKLLWRVGNRLFVSYLLIGVFPIPLILALAYILLYILSGQLSARRTETALMERVDEMRGLATALADDFDRAASPPERLGLFARHADGEGMGFSYLPIDGDLEEHGPAGGRELLAQGEPRTPLHGVTDLGEDLHLLVARASSHRGTVLVYQRLEPEVRELLDSRTRASAGFPQALANVENAKLTTRGNSVEVDIDGDGEDSVEIEPFGEPAPLEGGGWLAANIIFWARALDVPYLDWKDRGVRPEPTEELDEPVESDTHLLLLVRTSLAREYVELFRRGLAEESSDQSIGEIALGALLGLTVFIAFIYSLAALVAALLVFRIARTTKRLSRGFAEVERGNFEHRASLGGRDQLAGLVAGFNHMVGRLDTAVAERAEKEALERELQVARDLQRSLLPPADFQFPGVEIAFDFQPAAAIGGDFYHFIDEGGGRLVVVIADVSGHGLGTGIVMSAAKALLSALAAPGPRRASDEGVGLLHHLDGELRTLTEPRTFVTLAHCRFDLAAGRVDFTNAGHLYPYRITADGTVEALANASRPLGVGLPPTFRTVHGGLAEGDLWVFLSDGVVEGTDEGGEMFGFERLEALFAACAGSSAAAARQRILETWRAFTGHDQPEDDRTLIVVRIGPASV